MIANRLSLVDRVCPTRRDGCTARGPVQVIDFHWLGFPFHYDRTTVRKTKLRVSVVRLLQQPETSK